jgi:pimeloyl-ACP methyl ester carboxylesterase
MTEHTLQLADGRSLGYACYGAEDARPVLYFHGTPSSRLEPLMMDVYSTPIETLLQQYGLRLIAVDRPGMGLSHFHEQRTLRSFADDVHTLLQALNIQQCALLCWSGGGPYALTMAHHYGPVITGVYMLAGFSSCFGDEEVFQKMGWNKMYFNTARHLALALNGSLTLIKHQELKTPIHQELYDLSNVDYALLKDVDKLNVFLQYTLKEACREDASGAVQEAQLYFQPFPYTLPQVQTPVHFWWGTEDNTVTYIHAKRMEQQLPHATPHYKPGEGHVSIYVNCLEEALQTITGA